MFNVDSRTWKLCVPIKLKTKEFGNEKEVLWLKANKTSFNYTKLKTITK